MESMHARQLTRLEHDHREEQEAAERRLQGEREEALRRERTLEGKVQEGERAAEERLSAVVQSAAQREAELEKAAGALEEQYRAEQKRAEAAEASDRSKQERINELMAEIERLKAVKPGPPPLPTKKTGRWSNPGNGSGLFSNVPYLNDSTNSSTDRRVNQVNGTAA